MELRENAKEIRRNIVKCIASFGYGHIGGCLSIADVLAVLYFKHMRIDPKNPKLEGRDRFVLSKGHAGPALYATLAAKGYFDEDVLKSLNKLETKLPSHCDMVRTPGVDFTAGSLGQGFSAAVGIAIGSKLKKDDAYIYAIVGDGESQEGQIWEAAMYASQKKLNNLIAFTDLNGMQIDGNVDDINSLGDVEAKWKAFGFNTIFVQDGNNVDEIDKAIIAAKKEQNRPTMIILKTVKGKGISFIEKLGSGNHHVAFSPENETDALSELA